MSKTKTLIFLTSLVFWTSFILEPPLPAAETVPANLFNIGDSIGEGEAADSVIGVGNHQTVWSTGYQADDAVYSLNERFEHADSDAYYENNAERDMIFNQAVSGADMADFAAQVEEIGAAVQYTPSGRAGMIAILLGANDVCADSLDAMTSPEQFEAQFRAGLDLMAANSALRDARIHVSGIPAIYWLWEAKRSSSYCRLIWPFVPCQNLLAEPANDCGDGNSHLDPDTIYSDDGSNCIRRKMFHAKIRDIYNPILKNVLQEYKMNGRLPNANYINVFDVRFQDIHINDGDCFHPSVDGHSLLAEQQWCRSPWGRTDPQCPQRPLLPGLPLLLLDD